ncbi:MAG: hypothetical protein CMA63_06825 [Euryarchaeota archaeon]|nr:hypothetical protein [Euryarchaeota archaeon]|tara:strand:+ start:26484 stop:27026 length:543 start_codon:yes stop_codon:yes gene_type:complete
MSFIINPQDDSSTNGSGVSAPPWLTAGNHVCWAADLNYNQSKRGDTVIEVLFCCVQGEQAGARMYERFYLTAGAAWKLSRFARAVGHNESWDASDQERTRDILTSRPVQCGVSTWVNNKNAERPQLAKGQIDPYKGEITKQMEELVVALEDYAEGAKKKSAAPASGGGSYSAVGGSDIPF